MIPSVLWGEVFITLDNIFRGILFICCIQLLLYSSNYLLNGKNKCAYIKYVSSHVIKYQHILLAFVITFIIIIIIIIIIRVTLQEH